MIRLEEFLHLGYGYPGRPPADRTAIARAFVAKQVYDMTTTRVLLERLRTDRQVRRICGWEHLHEVPKEWTFSRAFAEFSADGLPERVHAALIRKNYEGEIVGHITYIPHDKSDDFAFRQARKFRSWRCCREQRIGAGIK